jgi:hypothetical protein
MPAVRTYSGEKNVRREEVACCRVANGSYGFSIHTGWKTNGGHRCASLGHGQQDQELNLWFMVPNRITCITSLIYAAAEYLFSVNKAIHGSAEADKFVVLATSHINGR